MGPGSISPLPDACCQLAFTGTASPPDPWPNEDVVTGGVVEAAGGVTVVTAGGFGSAGASRAEPVAIPATRAEPEMAAARAMTAAAVLALAAGDPGSSLVPGCVIDVDIASPVRLCTQVEGKEDAVIRVEACVWN